MDTAQSTLNLAQYVSPNSTIKIHLIHVDLKIYEHARINNKGHVAPATVTPTLTPRRQRETTKIGTGLELQIFNHTEA